MPYFLFSAAHFDVDDSVKGENIFIKESVKVDKEKALAQHRHLASVLNTRPHEAFPRMPDIVFSANVALVLPRLPRKVVVLSSFKHPVRQPEVAVFRRCMEAEGVLCVPFPKAFVFEGDGECKWFLGGQLLVVGYGYRCTKRSVCVLRQLLTSIYQSFNVAPPRVIGLRLASPFVYHMDLAMVETSPTSCVAHKGAFVDSSQLEKYVCVRYWKTDDPFLFNCLVTPTRAIVHKIMFERDRVFLKEALSPRTVVEVDVSEFEKSGGAVKCMVLKY
jgi:N-dimethylarginine dimethylaminohydrolase